MADIVLDGGPKTTEDLRVDANRTLRVDDSNFNLRLHDSVTHGGHTFLNRDNSDARYQARSVELEGLSGFEPQQRGILVRTGPAAYVLREIEVNENQFLLTNPNGFSGNPTLELNPTITTEHTWTGQQIFAETVEFQQGILADVEGDVTGNLTGNVTGNVTGNLTGNSTGTHTGPTIGDVDVRGANLLLDDGQIPLSKLVDLFNFIRATAFQPGMIIQWAGSIASIPAGWFLCTGANGTPNLTDRFIVAVGDGVYEPGDIGGDDSVTPTITVAAGGAHSHTLSGNTASALTGVTASKSVIRPEYEQNQVNVIGDFTLSDPGHTHPQGGTADSAGSHTHTATSSEIDNRPRYFALCYIMKG